MKKRLNGQRGFTLMELMVVIVIVAILAAVAVPLYINYVNDARDTEAKGAIGAVITAEQAYFQQHNSYAVTTLVANPVPNDPTSQGGLSCDVTDALRNWTIVTASTDPTAGFTVTATSKIPNYNRTVTYTYPPTGSDPWQIGTGN